MTSQPCVLPFDQLRMQDVASVGGKNASLGEMISQLSHLGVRVPGGFATTAAAYREFLAHGGLAEKIDTCIKGLDVDNVRALAETGASIRRWISDAPFRPARNRRFAQPTRSWSMAARPRLSFAVRSSATAEDSARRLLRRAAGDVPQHSRHRQRAAERSSTSSLRSTTTARSPIACTRASAMPTSPCRQACSAWCAATSPPAASCSRSTPNPASTRWCSSPPATDWARRWCRGGQSRRVLRLQAGAQCRKAGDPAPRPRLQSYQDGVYRQTREAGRSVQTLDVPEAERRRFSITDAEVEELARYAMIIEKHYGRPMDIEWGTRRRRRQALHPAGTARNREGQRAASIRSSATA